MKVPKNPSGREPGWDPRERALLRRLIRSNTGQPAEMGRVVEIPETFGEDLIIVATNAWRIRSKLVDSSGNARENVSNDDLRKILRYAESVLEALGRVGMEVKDRTNEPFDYGLPEKVVTTQPQEGLSKEIIIETIRPTIYWNGQIAQQGEVVLATPAASTPAEEPS